MQDAENFHRRNNLLRILSFIRYHRSDDALQAVDSSIPASEVIVDLVMNVLVQRTNDYVIRSSLTSSVA